MLIFKRVMVFICLSAVSLAVLSKIVESQQQCCFDSSTWADAWLDANANGQREHDESPLANVCVWSPISLDVPQEADVARICGDSLSLTDQTGHWPAKGQEAHSFRAGAKCTDLDVFAKPPDGYIATTPLAINGCQGAFGFVSTSAVDVSSRNYLQEYEKHIQARQTSKQLENLLPIATLLVVVALCAFLSVKLVRPSKPSVRLGEQ
ncbi:MAG: hypothetical protein U0559_08550 [Anaerolineae bacterium]